MWCIDIFEDEKEKKFYEKFLELRHIYVHQAGYIREPASASEEIQEDEGYLLNRRSLGIGEVSLLMDTLCKIANRLDRKASEKFNVKSPDEYFSLEFEPDEEISPEDIKV